MQMWNSKYKNKVYLITHVGKIKGKTRSLAVITTCQFTSKSEVKKLRDILSHCRSPSDENFIKCYFNQNFNNKHCTELKLALGKFIHSSTPRLKINMYIDRRLTRLYPVTFASFVFPWRVTFLPSSSYQMVVLPMKLLCEIHPFLYHSIHSLP